MWDSSPQPPVGAPPQIPLWICLHEYISWLIITGIMCIKCSSKKIYSDFESILDVVFDGGNQNYMLLLFHAKNRNKRVKNTKKWCFMYFSGLKFENVQIKLKG